MFKIVSTFLKIAACMVKIAGFSIENQYKIWNLVLNASFVNRNSKIEIL